MSDAQTKTDQIPEWDLADRMRKALRQQDVGVQEMADYLGVARNTVSTWINGRINPSAQTLRLWSMRCGVSLEWLRSGSQPDPGGEAQMDRRTPRGQGSASTDLYTASTIPLLRIAA